MPCNIQSSLPMHVQQAGEGELKPYSKMSVLHANKCAARKSERQRESVSSQTDKTGQREFLFACQTLSLMFKEEKKSEGFYSASLLMPVLCYTLLAPTRGYKHRLCIHVYCKNTQPIGDCVA